MSEKISFLAQGGEINLFVLFGSILLLGLLGGELANRVKNVPRIFGFIALGFILGPSVTGFLTPAMLDMSRVFVDMALAIILFKIATYIDIRLIRKHLPVFWTSLAESGLTFVFIAVGLIFLGFPPVQAVMAGAIGMSSSPAVILLVMRELKAHGRVTIFAINLVALNNLLSFTMYIVLLPILHASNSASLLTIILQPIYSFAGALALAWLLGRGAIYMMRWVGHNHDNVFPIFMGLLALALGLAEWLNF
ncbi:MAG TPA: cation:proton antiporter, partial [Alphaproteobacteria bacterium]|nr:cation:proton antiporter [Alphaproteobacteria bacterium]